jgi:tight adherence protein C
MTYLADTHLFLPIFGSLSVLATALGLYHISRRARLRARLRDVTQDAAPEAAYDSLMEKPLPWIARAIGFLGVLLPNHIYSTTLRMEMSQAGYHHPDTPRVFAGIRVLSTVLLGVGNLILATQLKLADNEIILVTGVALAAGYLVPQMVLRWKQNKRREELTLSLPDALDLLVICVEAGQALNAAILNVGKEIRLAAPALSQELSLVNHEMRAGMSRTQALRNLAMRTGVDDVRALVAVLVQSDRFGTSVAQALRIHAQSLRTRRRQRAEEAARKAPVKLVFPLVFCNFPELMVVILAPGMLEMFRALADMARG